MKNLITLMLAGIFILTVCFCLSISYDHPDLPNDTISGEFLDFLDDS